jgi:hypothetical protein
MVNAQWRRNVTPADTLTSIVTNADGSTTFRIYAPKAEKVTPGGHSWHVWHYDLHDFAPRLFK